MANIIELKQLIERYESVIQECERKMVDAKRRQNIARQALELLNQEGITDIEIPKPRAVRLVESNDLATGMSTALRKIFESHAGEFLSAQDIYDELINGGFHSKSANIKRDVYVRLYRMEKLGLIESKEEEGIKRYTLKKNH